jgi:hypothetical protein
MTKELKLKTKFVANYGSWKPPIQNVLIQSESAHFVTLATGRRESKADSSKAYFDTWKEAQESVLNYYKVKVAQYQSLLDIEKANLKKANDIMQKEII